MSPRLSLALPGGAKGEVLILGADASMDLSGFDPAHTRITQPMAPDHAALAARGWQVTPRTEATVTDRIRADTIIVFIPRSRAEARARLAEAEAHLAPGGVIWVDGLKIDGIESILRELRTLTPVESVISKAHGKIFCLISPHGQIPDDWVGRDIEAAPGFITRPGVFSADGIDPGSAMLAEALPARLPKTIVDLGAGWGWLSAQILMREGVETLHLIEADAIALDCARHNITDPRARFHWADAIGFSLSEPVNAVIMNPPFHAGARRGDARIGADFIAAAARLLTGSGRLWMVANRHLPYEAALAQHFAQFEEIGGDNRFKLFLATGAGRVRKAGKR